MYSIAIEFIYGLIYPSKPPVDTSLTKEQYIAKCEEVAPEEFYRNSEKYNGEFVKLELVVVKSAASAAYYDVTSYICKDADGGEFEIIVHSYLLENEQNLLPGDKITVYGEGAGTDSVYDNGDIYLLNTDYDCPILAEIFADGKYEKVEVAPLELKKVSTGIEL